MMKNRRKWPPMNTDQRGLKTKKKLFAFIGVDPRPLRF